MGDTVSTGWRYLHSLVRQPGMGRRVGLLGALAVLSGLLDGMGLGFLLPIVRGLQGEQDSVTSQDQASAMVGGFFAALGLPQSVPVALGFALVVFVGQASCVYLRLRMTSLWQNQLVFAFRSHSFSNLLNCDLTYIHQTRVGELVNALVTEAYRAGYAFRAMIEMSSAACVLVAYVALELAISWKLTVLTFPLLGVIAMFLKPRESYQLGLRYTKENDALTSTASESLGGIREIKGLGIAPLIRERFEATARAIGEVDAQLLVGGARFALAYQCVVFAMVAVIVLVASRWEALALGPLLVFLIVLQRLAPRVGTFTEQRHVWLGSAGAMEKVRTLLEETTSNRRALRHGTAPFGQLTHGIEFDRVSFRHVGQVTDTLRGVSFRIPRGAIVAIVGVSGAGKSTALDLLARFYDPDGGAIRIDGRNLSEFDVDSWRKGIGLVSQETFLFNDNVENNIRFGRLDASSSEVLEAAGLAHAHEFITALPAGYATVVGDRGCRLSGGQRQRIALARALLRWPKILILDEATSQLDAESERAIQDAIRGLHQRCTVLMAAHRLSAVKDADRILVLEAGMLVESGSHADLLASGGRYVDFLKAQVAAPPAVIG